MDIRLRFHGQSCCLMRMGRHCGLLPFEDHQSRPLGLHGQACSTCQAAVRYRMIRKNGLSLSQRCTDSE